MPPLTLLLALHGCILTPPDHKGLSDQRSSDTAALETTTLTSSDNEDSRTLDALRAASSVPPILRMEDGFPEHVWVDVPTSGADPLERALDFLGTYAHLYGLDDPVQELILDTHDVADGMDFMHFVQRHDGLAVWNSSIALVLNRDRLQTTIGRLHPHLPPLPAAILTEEEAQEVALSAFPIGLAMVRGHSVEIVVPGVGPSGEPIATRALRLHVLGEHPDTRQGWQWEVLVDLVAGTVIEVIDQTPTDKDIIVQSAQNTTSDNCFDWAWEGQDTTWFEEGGSSAQYETPHPDYFDDGFEAWSDAHDWYDWMMAEFDRDSYNNGGAQINTMVHVGDDWDNANWVPWCGHAQFGTGWLELDVFAHEWGHALDSASHDLQYQNQSGALDEHYADLWGALLDDDDPEMGEGVEDYNGSCPDSVALRDLSNPPRCGDPDHMLAAVSGDNKGLRKLEAGESPDCNDGGNDCGYVHTNSGIPNKVSWLLMEGGQHNNFTITPIGREKMARLAYTSVTLLLSSDASFMNARDAEWSAAAFFANTSTHDFTIDDVCQVRNAWASVGLGAGDKDCDGELDNVDPDDDGDYIADSEDNCLNLANYGQNDIDEDGAGDLCDTDMDGDSVTNVNDNCPTLANSNQADSDGDNIGNLCEDTDGDKLLDTVDNCDTVPNADQKDLDSDSQGDVCDDDDDGDDVPDISDVCPEIQDDQSDNDSDDVGNACDNCVDVPNPDQADCDGNGIGAACESPFSKELLFGDSCGPILPELQSIFVHPGDIVSIPVCDSCGRWLPDGYTIEIVAILEDGQTVPLFDDRGTALGRMGRAPTVFRPDAGAAYEIPGVGLTSSRGYFLEVPDSRLDELSLTLDISVQ